MDDFYIDIWKADLSLDDEKIKILKGFLSEDEISRCLRLISTQKQRRFIGARGMLRKIISKYIPFKPKDLRFSYNPNGKPQLSNDMGDLKLFFNLTHCENRALVAITKSSPLGIDIEKERNIKFLDIAKRYFSSSEFNQIKSLPLKEQRLCFFRCWTRREAYIKGKGSSVWWLIDKIETCYNPLAGITRIKNRLNPEDKEKWSIVDIDLEAPFLAALAYEGEIKKINMYDFNF